MAPARYTPLLKIAAGGMATVFVGITNDGTLVALKRPHEHLIDDHRFMRSLKTEAELGRKLSHPNVVGIDEVVIEDDTMYLVMKYVDGATLGEVVASCAARGQRIPLRAAARILLDACAGLGFAHDLTEDTGRRRGIVHRDVSPANILVGADGVARVSDFGIAKALDQADATTTTGVKGKLAYMAPEYIRGQGLDQRSDVFALGIVAWEVLAGRRLFKASNDAATIDRVVNLEAPKLAEIDAGLASFDEVIAHALAKDPVERFLNANEFREAFEAVVRHIDAVGSVEDVQQFVESAVGPVLEKRRADVASALHAAGRTTAPGIVVQAPRPETTTTTELMVPADPTLRESAAMVAPPDAERTSVSRRPLAALAALVLVTLGILGAGSWVFLHGRHHGAETETLPAASTATLAASAPASTSRPVVVAPVLITPVEIAPLTATPTSKIPPAQTVVRVHARDAGAPRAPADTGGWHPAPASQVYGDAGR